MADENVHGRSMVNGDSKQNGVITNGHCSSDDNDRKSEASSTTSSTRNLANELRDRPPLPSQPPRPMEKQLPPRMKVSRPSSASKKFIPENEITIPSDGNIQEFSVDEMVTFFKHIGVEDRIVNHLQRKELDGKRFSKLRDSDLETIGIKNPIIMHFRDKSNKGKKQRES
ncbi:hypothetical protein KUTeg_016640 [Tegillarca granosa]|uniref:SAM domain-containing protein n=1 Tax=Tegillarca granosa TaxID=220873 RepID=A0ABQ9ELN4_TEGGR|nr:hypothetical protein KUTeg_016640 [Tegillarca granosa]